MSDYSRGLKIGVLIIAFWGAHVLLGLAGRYLYGNYRELWTDMATRVAAGGGILSSVGLTTLTTGVLVALVRPWRWVMVAIVGGSILLIVASGVGNQYAWLIGVIYGVMVSAYATAVVAGLNERLNFTLRPFRDEHPLLRRSLALVLCASFVGAYWQTVQHGEPVVPPALPSLLWETMQPAMQAALEQQKMLTPLQRQLAGEQFPQIYAHFWDNVAAQLQPQARLVAVGLGAGLIWLMTTALSLVDWIALVILEALFYLLKAVGFACEVVEPRMVRRLVLGGRATASRPGERE